MKKERKQKFEMYNYRILWSIAQKNLDLSRKRASEDDTLLYALAAMLLVYFAFEGYLNWLGHHIAPEVWDREKEFFGRSPYQGTLGKYHYLAEILNLPTDQSQRPFQTAKELQQLRDKTVHPRPESGSQEVKFTEGQPPPNYKPWLSTKVSPDKRDRAENDIEKLVKGLHKAAKSQYHDLITTSEHLSGMLCIDSTDY